MFYAMAGFEETVLLFNKEKTELLLDDILIEI